MRIIFALLWTAALVLGVVGCVDQPTSPDPQPGGPRHTAVQISGDEPCPDCTDYNPRGGDYPTSPVAGGGAPDSTQNDTITPCQTDNEILNDPKVQAGLDSLWKESNPDAAAIGERKEHFAWIVQTANGYEVRDFGLAGTFCGVDGTVYPPPEGMAAVVGWVHSHPYRLREWVLTCGSSANQISGYAQYTSRPSPYDRRNAAAMARYIGKPDLRGYLIDSEKIVSFTASRRDDHPYNRCGY